MFRVYYGLRIYGWGGILQPWRFQLLFGARQLFSEVIFAGIRLNRSRLLVEELGV